MQLPAAKYYPYKVWISTLLFGSIMGIWLNFVRRPDTLSFEAALLHPIFLFLAGLISTLPAFGFYYGTYHLLQKTAAPGELKKGILILVSISLILAFLYFVLGEAMLQSSNRDGYLLTISYCFVTIICGFGFKLKNQSH